MKHGSDEFDGLDDLALLGFGMALLLGLIAAVTWDCLAWAVRLPGRAWRAWR